MAKKELSPVELIESHKPKNFKYYYIIKDEELITQLQNEHYNFDELNTINNPEIIKAAMNADYQLYERTIIGKAKEPTIMDNGVVITKKMVTKADKKLQQFGVGYFSIGNTQYVAIRMFYEKFDIIEVFILT